jgi:two-component system, NtrC family, response regulator GlrR
VAKPDEPQHTAPATPKGPERRFRCFVLEVIGGPSDRTKWSETGERCTIGSHPSNDLIVQDPTVSRFHCEITAAGGRFRVRDLGSRNGTAAGDVTIADGFVGPGAVLAIGNSRVRITAEDRDAAVPALPPGAAFGGLVGSSVAMREAFARLERAAASDATVLLQGETGTGKEGAAAALHASGARAQGPFVAIDCGAIPPTLFEAELFGSEPGAYTGSTGRRIGAFEEASGGTLFLDEVGELASEVQAKLLRALETRQIRRLGSPEHVASLARSEWPGNVRELRNHLEECLVFGVAPDRAAAELAAEDIAYEPARKRALEKFESEYVEQLLRRAGGNVAEAAKLAGVNRAYLYRLIQRHRAR